MPYRLFLDDIREPNQVFKTTANHEWTTVRSYEGFVQTIKEKGLPFMVSFDHDLADVHYPFNNPHVGADIPYDSYKEKTGYHAAQWLVTHCLDNNLELPKWNVHSANPVGRQNIIGFLQSYEKFYNSQKSEKGESS